LLTPILAQVSRDHENIGQVADDGNAHQKTGDKIKVCVFQPPQKDSQYERQRGQRA
jgi:hypothetical protein